MGAVPNNFMANVLAQLKAPQTTVNIQSLQTWRQFEGGTALWNPLDTTEYRPGATPYNTFGGNLHVWNYPNAAVGEEATASTLKNGQYTAILVKLWDSAPLPLWNDPSVLEQLDTWGTHGFAAYIRTLQPPKPPDPPEEEIVISCFVPGVGDWVLFENAGRYVHVSSPPDVAALVAAGAKQITISAEQHAEFLAAFPNSVPAPA